MTIPMIDNEIMWERMSLEDSLRRDRVAATRRRRMTAVIIFSALALAWAVMLISYAKAAEGGGPSQRCGAPANCLVCANWNCSLVGTIATVANGVYTTPSHAQEDFGVRGFAPREVRGIKDKGRLGGDKGFSDDASKGE